MNRLLGVVAVVIIAPLATLITGAAVAPFVLWRAWVTWMLYGWFAVPAGAPELGFLHLLGLAMVVHSVKPSVPAKAEKGQTEDEKRAELRRVLVQMALGPLVTLGIGAAIHTWGMP